MIGPKVRGAPHPCTANQCTACCFGTRLSLLDEDVVRLEAAGHRGFTVRDPEGYLRLRNLEGHCIFLDGKGCSVYAIRPDGCRTYPLVYYEEDDEVDFDAFCPPWRQFARRPGTVLRVLRSIWIDDRQALLRRRMGP